MFDAKQLIEMMMGGAGQGAGRGPAGPSSGGLGGLGDILGQVLAGGGPQPGQPAAPGGRGGLSLDDLLRNLAPGGAQPGGASSAPGSSGGGLDDLLRRIGGAGGPTASDPGRYATAPDDRGAPPPTGSSGGLGDVLGEVQRRLGGAPGTSGAPGTAGPGDAGGLGGIGDILRQVLGHATDGAREGAGRIGEATGAREALERATGGRSVDDLLGQLRDVISNNQMASGAAMGGLGAVVLGTETGRRMAARAAKLGALALIGGLAYKAYQNYSAGRPMLGGPGGSHALIEAPPSGSGFEPQAITNETATLYIRAMIAAAAADGRIDEGEQERILGSLKQSGVEQGAMEFLELEIQSPASTDDLAAAVTSPEVAVQVYAAARLAIDPDTGEEQGFLKELAGKLGVDAELAGNIEALAAASH